MRCCNLAPICHYSIRPKVGVHKVVVAERDVVTDGAAQAHCSDEFTGPQRMFFTFERVPRDAASYHSHVPFVEPLHIKIPRAVVACRKYRYPRKCGVVADAFKDLAAHDAAQAHLQLSFTGLSGLAPFGRSDVAMTGAFGPK